MATISHPRIDAAEFTARQQQAGWRLGVELIGGEGVVIPPTGRDASAVQGELFHALRLWQQLTSDGGLVLQDVFIRLGGDYVLAPDIGWWQAERRPAPRQGALDVVPDLVVEVLSPATRENDLGPKRDAYANAAVRELWLVDPPTKQVTVCAGEQLRGEEVFPGTLQSLLLEDFGLDLRDVFAG